MSRLGIECPTCQKKLITRTAVKRYLWKASKTGITSTEITCPHCQTQFGLIAVADAETYSFCFVAKPELKHKVKLVKRLLRHGAQPGDIMTRTKCTMALLGERPPCHHNWIYARMHNGRFVCRCTLCNARKMVLSNLLNFLVYVIKPFIENAPFTEQEASSIRNTLGNEETKSELLRCIQGDLQKRIREVEKRKRRLEDLISTCNLAMLVV